MSENYQDSLNTEEARIAYLKYLCERGWNRLIRGVVAENQLKIYKERLNFEIEVLTLKGFISYFLVVQDYVNHVKSKGVMVGPGRGSGAGSLVSYLLGITEVDPIENNLLFERFLSPELPIYNFDLGDYEVSAFLADPDDYKPQALSSLVIDFGTHKRFVKDRWDQLTVDEKDAALLEYKYMIRQRCVNYALEIPEVSLENDANSWVLWLFGKTDEQPTSTSLNRLRVRVPGSSAVPDFDVDFADVSKSTVQEYIWNKYGKNDHVAIIGATQTLGAKQAFHDICKVYEIDKAVENKIINAIEQVAGKTGNFPLEHLLRHSGTLQVLQKQYPVIFESVARLEGLARNGSKHAAGMVMSPDPITNHVPLWKPAADSIAVTQLPWEEVEALGLMKVDILSLTTLTVIQTALRLIKKNTQEQLDLIKVDHNDSKVWTLLKEGAFCDIFQVDARDAARELTKDLAPNSIGDLTALVALNRPGPLQVGLHTHYINRKHGRERVEYVLPQLKEILSDTYGVMIYQEQIVQIARLIAGYTIAEADDLRKAISKTIPEKIRRQKTIFLNGCRKNNVPDRIATELFEQFVKFGEYCFNRAHSRCYAEITYRTAWLKANYPLEFYTASADNADSSFKVQRYLKEAERYFDIIYMPPDINRSKSGFTCDRDTNTIIYGLGIIKGVGAKALEVIKKARKNYGEFTSFVDFINKIKRYATDTGERGLACVNKRVQEALIKGGAFDYLKPFEECDFECTRTTYLKYRESLIAGKVFDAGEVVKDSYHNIQTMEREVYDNPISISVLGPYTEIIEQYKLGTIAQARDMLCTKIACEIVRCKVIQDRNKNTMCFLEVQDAQERASVTVFSDSFEKAPEVYQAIGTSIALRIQLDKGGENFLADGVKPLELLRDKDREK